MAGRPVRRTGAARRAGAGRSGVRAVRRGNRGPPVRPAAARLGHHAALVVRRADHAPGGRPGHGPRGGRPGRQARVDRRSHHAYVRYRFGFYELRDLPGVRAHPAGHRGHHRVPRPADRHGHRDAPGQPPPPHGRPRLRGARGGRRGAARGHGRRDPAELGRRRLGGGGGDRVGRLHPRLQGGGPAPSWGVRPGHRDVRGGRRGHGAGCGRGGAENVPAVLPRCGGRHRAAVVGHPLLAGT
jgi:hypothetical protein